MPAARAPWALDSGGFTELSMRGEWSIDEVAYAQAVYRFRDEIGHLQWAAPMDWMCEPAVRQKTGLTVKEHQRRTIENYLDLRSLAPDLPFIPVLQGWETNDYLRHVESYLVAGVDLAALPLVGVGSVCRRQATGEIEHILAELARGGLRLHGFGVKMSGLRRYADVLASADSMAWSYRARLAPPMAGCTHKSCANCLRWATRWHGRVLRRLEETQMRLAL